MQPLFLDFESYWADDYTLRQMTPVEYIADPRFEALGCGFVTMENDREWVDGPLLPEKFAEIDWSQTFALSHNALFDMLILSMRYKVFPRMYGCTLSMARNWLAHHINSQSLEAVCQYYGMPPKWGTVNKTKGVSFAMLQELPQLHEETADYGIDDAAKCRNIFIRMMGEGFPPSQLKIIDWVVRMAALPSLELDQFVLAEYLGDIEREKQALLDRAKLADRDNLMSDQVFAAMLLFEGVVPPTKKSKTQTDKDIYAFAKTDKEFTALLEHENPMIQALVAARLGHKSTIEETRTRRLFQISQVSPLLPVPLKFSGAHTHRFSGDWKINLQNLMRGSKLRTAIKAPKGKVIVAADASQIEARMNATLSQQWDLVGEFKQGIDVYARFAETIYQKPISKAANPVERFVGKQGILSLGYGASWLVFQAMCRNQGKVILQDSEATSIVFLYRQKYKQIVQNWEYADKIVLPLIATGELPLAAQMFNAPGESVDPNWRAWGPVGIERYSLLLPSDNRLRYRDLHQEISTVLSRQVWTYMRGKMYQHIYGAKLVENVIQALAFIHITEVAMRIWDMTEGLLWPAHQVHDELIYVTDEKLAEMVRQLVVREMARPPAWMPMAPLAAEGHIGITYGDAK